MIRIGRYDAFEKWRLLCRHWENPGAMVGRDIVTKWGVTALPIWQIYAFAGANAAVREYIQAKLLWLRSDAGASPDDPINRELAHLAARLGEDEVLALVHQREPTITSQEFHISFDQALSPELTERLREVFRNGAIGMLGWTEGAGEVPNIEAVRARRNRPFPVGAIKHKKKVLSLFCALNYGLSDAIHIHDACPDHVTFVDNRADLMGEMQLIYPPEWTYVSADFREFIQRAVTERHSYDLIVADENIPLAREMALDLLPAVMSICSDTCIMNYTTDVWQTLGVAPDDLAGLSRSVAAITGIDLTFTEMMKRNDRVYWAVMRKAAA